MWEVCRIPGVWATDLPPVAYVGSPMTRALLATVMFVALGPAGVASRVASADCAATELQTTVVTPQDAEIPSDGGILVAATFRTGVRKDNDGEAVRPGWRLRGKKLTAPKIDVLAPGLAVYRVTFDGKAGPVELEDEDHKVVAKVIGSKAKLAQLAAPDLKKVSFSAMVSRHSSQRIQATLVADAPPEAYALVIADAKGTAKSWGLVSKGLVQYPYSHNDCEMLPNGTTVAAIGSMVTVYWVTADGRRSAASKPIKLTGQAVKPNPY